MCSNGVFNVRKIKYCTSIQSRSSVWGKKTQKEVIHEDDLRLRCPESFRESHILAAPPLIHILTKQCTCVFCWSAPPQACLHVCVCVMQLCVCALQYTWEPKVQIFFVKHGRTNTQLHSHARATAACSAVGGDVWTSCQHIYILVLRKLCTRQ